MRHGFKSQCEQISKRYRKELGLSLEDALPYRLFAEHLSVRIWNPRDVPGLEVEHLNQLTVVDPSAWSAMALDANGNICIIVNSTHSERRLANDVCHELSHIILDHKKTRLDIDVNDQVWLKSYNKEQEEEADWLSAALLLPRDGLISVCRRGLSLTNLSDHFAVSEDLVRMRMNRTGINKQLSYTSR